MKERKTINTNLYDYLEETRYENAEAIPNLDIIISDSLKGNLHDFIGKTLIVIFLVLHAVHVNKSYQVFMNYMKNKKV